MTDAEVCMKAARLIERHGLAKGLLMDSLGRVCAFGALNFAHHRSTQYLRDDPYAQNLSIRVFGIKYAAELAEFNNRPDTTQDEVIALLESGAYSVTP